MISGHRLVAAVATAGGKCAMRRSLLVNLALLLITIYG